MGPWRPVREKYNDVKSSKYFFIVSIKTWVITEFNSDPAFYTELEEFKPWVHGGQLERNTMM